MPDIKEKIDQAWRLRINQQLEEATSTYALLKQEIGLPSGDLSSDSVNAARFVNSDPQVTADVLLLGASIARAQRRFSYSEELIGLTEKFLSSYETTHNYHLHFEKGLTAFMRGNHISAMEDFMMATKLSGTRDKKAASLTNTLLCLENLSLPYENTLTELNSIVKQLEDGHLSRAILSELQTLKLRNLFRSGKLDEIFTQRNSNEEFSQPKYFTLWIQTLPFHKFHCGPEPRELEELAKNIQYFHQGPYRLRTLQGIQHPDDQATARFSDVIARIYSWTWRWLVNPESFPVHRIISILSHTNLSQEAHRLIHEDRQLLRNSLLWLGLFGQNSYEEIQKTIQKFQNAGKEDHSIYEIEKLIIDFIFALRDDQQLLAKDLLTTIEAHPLYNTNDILFAKLIKTLNKQNGLDPANPLKQLAGSILTLLSRTKKNSSYTKSINPSTYEIKDLKRSQRLISEPMTLALKLLHKNPIVSCEEFMATCFGITKFDSLIHNGKIFNLLSRMRQIFSKELRFKTKTGKIIVEGKWDSIHFQKSCPLTEQLIQEDGWRTLLANGNYHKQEQTKKIPAKATTATQLNKEWFCRHELEEVLGVPRSTANRRIKKWLDDSLVQQKGRGRSTQYKLKEALRQQLFQNGETQ